MNKTTFIVSIFVIFFLLSLTSCIPKETSENAGNTDSVNDKTPGEKEIIENPTVENPWDKTVAKETLSISELKKKNPKDGIYETVGYVVDIYAKCDCPPDMLCKCPAPHIVISEENIFSASRGLNDKELKIETSPFNPGDFETGKKYRFKVKNEYGSIHDQKLESAELVAYK